LLRNGGSKPSKQMGASSLPFTAGSVRTSGRVGALHPAVFVGERIAAGAALIIAAPVLGAVLGTVRVLSGMSPLVAHRRVGLGGEPIWVLKVRTMWPGGSGAEGWVERLDDPDVPPVKRRLDPRITSRFAAFCRRHSIDELPQLVHVLTGRMRLIGPRPMTRQELDEHYREWAEEVLSVRPGLTGLWQVMGRNRLSYAQRRRLDVFLVRRGSWGLSLRIMLRTIREVWKGSGL
jgi:exopolysaccharide production protein ExoY